MQAVNSYIEAIELLINSDVDYKKVCVALAKQYPDIFVNLAKPVPVASWAMAVVEHLENSRYVNAIKQVRETNGNSLKEAKDIVDNLLCFMQTRGYPVSTRIEHPPILDADEIRVYQFLVKAVDKRAGL